MLVDQFVDTYPLKPHLFAEFRAALGTASGVQSHQFKELEIQGGLREQNSASPYRADSWEHACLTARQNSPCLRQAFISLLRRLGLIPSDVPSEPSSEDIRSALRRVYAETQYSSVQEVAEALYEYDQAFVDFRWRHIRLVERTIGRLRGTHLTDRASFLERKLSQRFFREIADVRTEVLVA